jgi:hypothetical protein
VGAWTVGAGRPRPTAGVDGREQTTEFAPDGPSVEARQSRLIGERGPEQLHDRSVRDTALSLVGTGLENGATPVANVARENVAEAGLADPRLAGDHRDPTNAAGGRRVGGTERFHRGVTSDEGRHRREFSADRADLLTRAWASGRDRRLGGLIRIPDGLVPRGRRLERGDPELTIQGRNA